MAIKKEGKSYVVRSEKSGRNMGRYTYTNKMDRDIALAKARNRLNQIEYFKSQRTTIPVRKHRRKGNNVRKHRRRLR